jgi:hypothetical protein
VKQIAPPLFRRLSTAGLALAAALAALGAAGSAGAAVNDPS